MAGVADSVGLGVIIKVRTLSKNQPLQWKQNTSIKPMIKSLQIAPVDPDGQTEDYPVFVLHANFFEFFNDKTFICSRIICRGTFFGALGDAHSEERGNG